MLKNAFSTLGCPNWSFKDIISAAKDLGFNGIEIRGMGSLMYAPNLPIFNRSNIKNTLDTMKNSGIEFSMLTSGCDLSADDFENTYKEACDYINLAKYIDCHFVRIMCENSPGIKNHSINIEVIAKRYQKICDFAKSLGVLPLIETNSILADSENMLRFLNHVNRDNAFVLWDIHHPFRFFNESPEYTYGKLKNYIKYIHIKDSVMINGETQYRLSGYGDIPIFDSLKILNDNGFDGYISLEWTKRWNPDLQDSGIVIPHYANFIKDLINDIKN